MGIIPFTHAPMRLAWANILSEVAPVAKIPPFFSKPRPKPDYSHYFLSSSDYGEWEGNDEQHIEENPKYNKSKKGRKHYEYNKYV